jgi:hypothetical protein
MADNDSEWGDGACNNTLGWGLAQTKFGCATPCADVRVNNSNSSYTEYVASGASLELPDITVTDSNGSTFTAPAVTNVTCTPAVSRTTAMLIKTGQTTSFRTGDDGDLEAGRATSFTVLSGNNPFGNTNRFTDELGGQTYANRIAIDWSTFDGTKVLGYYYTIGASDVTWNAAIDAAAALSVGRFASGWRLTNIHEMLSICNYQLTQLLNYSPFNVTNTLWLSTTYAASTTLAYTLSGSWINLSGKSGAAGRWIAVRTFTVTGTTLS